MKPSKRRIKAGPLGKPIRKASWILYTSEDNGVTEGVVLRSYYEKKTVIHRLDVYYLKGGSIGRGLRAKTVYNRLLVCV